jgi:DNA helicase-2/ATP-dependent DNA helicase PcrA
MTRLTLAGPGAGKTQDLCSQINTRLKNGVNPYAILAITFSRKAAAVITERTMGRVEGRTFHGFANWIIRLGCKFRNENPPEIIPEGDQEDLIKEAIKQGGDSFLEMEEVKRALTKMRVLKVPEEAFRPQVVEAAKRYLELLDQRNEMDFTRILERGARELYRPQVMSQVEKLFKAVFIDEGQDCNPYLEYPLIAPFLDIMEMYSSPSQQIYSFRGADWALLANYLPDNLSIRTIRENYRSTPEIVASSLHLAGPDASEMFSTRDSLGIPVKIYKSARDSVHLTVQTIASLIKEWERRGIGPDRVAVLTRSSGNAQIRRGLTHYDVPLAEGSFFASEVVQGALAHLRLALYPTDPRALDAAMGFPGPALGMMTRSLLDKERITWDELANLISQDEFAAQEQAKALRMYRRHAYYQTCLRKFQQGSSLPWIIQDLLAPLRDTLMKEGWFAAANEIDQLAALSSEFDSLSRFVDYLRTEVENVKYTESGVTVTTIHKSKGTEYQGVIIPGWIAGRIPVESDDPQTEQNLAFVGMTRARDRLALMVPGSPPSPYLRGMRETSVVQV